MSTISMGHDLTAHDPDDASLRDIHELADLIRHDHRLDEACREVGIELDSRLEPYFVSDADPVGEAQAKLCVGIEFTDLQSTDDVLRTFRDRLVGLVGAIDSRLGEEA
jgi:hypothetical protein